MIKRKIILDIDFNNVTKAIAKEDFKDKNKQLLSNSFEYNIIEYANGCIKVKCDNNEVRGFAISFFNKFI